MYPSPNPLQLHHISFLACDSERAVSASVAPNTLEKSVLLYTDETCNADPLERCAESGQPTYIASPT